MSDAPPPIESPQVPRDDASTAKEPITGSFLVPASVKDVRNATTEITRYVASADLKWFAATMAGAAVVSVLLVGWFDARGAERQLPMEKRVEKLETEQATSAQHMVRLETMAEMQLRDRGIQPPPPVPAPAAVKDGGP